MHYHKAIMLALAGIFALALAGCPAGGGLIWTTTTLSTGTGEGTSTAHLVLRRGWDDAGLLAEMEYALADTNETLARVSLLRDALGRLVRIETEYDGDGAPDSILGITRGNGGGALTYADARGVLDPREHVYTEDDAGRILSLETDEERDGDVDRASVFRYDEDGALIAVEHDWEDDGVVDHRERVMVDSAGRVVEIHHDQDGDGDEDLSVLNTHDSATGFLTERRYRGAAGNGADFSVTLTHGGKALGKAYEPTSILEPPLPQALTDITWRTSEAATRKLDTRTEVVDGVTAAYLSGQIADVDDDRVLRILISDLLEQGVRKLVLELSELSTVDSMGLGQLLSAYTQVRHRDGRMVLADVHPNLYSLLQMTRLDSVFEIYDSVEDAAAAFN